VFSQITVNFSTAHITLICWQMLKTRVVVYKANMRVVRVANPVLLEALAAEHVL